MREDDFYQEAFSRNIGLINKEDQQKLRNAKIAIAGLGGVGGAYLLNLIRLGIGNFHIADFDSFELVNFNRQAGAAMDSIGRQKTEAMFEMAKNINPFANVQIFPDGVHDGNINQFLEGVNVVLDGLDFFNIKTRIMLFKEARKRGIYAITAAPIGFGASLLTFSLNGMSFEDYFSINENMDEKEMTLLFGLGLSPSLAHRKYFKINDLDISGKKAPSLVGGTLVCASFVIAETVKIIFGKKVVSAPVSLQFDPYLQCLRKKVLIKGNNGPIQLIKRWVVKKWIMG